MTVMASKLTKEHLEQIEGYLSEKFPVLGAPARGKKSAAYEFEIRERIVRVEESLKNQQSILEKMLIFMEKRFEQVEKRFEQVDKRFEQMEKRFEQVDKRFEQVDRKFTMLIWFMGFGFTLVTAFITGFMTLIR